MSPSRVREYEPVNNPINEAVKKKRPAELALADWLEELAVYAQASRPLDSEIAYQLCLAIENWYLVRVGLQG